MADRGRGLSSPWIKMEDLEPQPENLLTLGIGNFSAASDRVTEKVVKKVEDAPLMAPNNNGLVCPKMETISPIANSSTNVPSNMDPRRVKRLLANRASARRARQRHVEYVERLKHEIKTHKARLSIISPQLSYHEAENAMIKRENDAMKDMLRALTSIRLRKEAEYEALKEELREMSRTLCLLPPKDPNV